MVAFLELRELDRVDDYEQIRVPSLGLTFGFYQDVDEPERLLFVFVELPTCTQEPSATCSPTQA